MAANGSRRRAPQPPYEAQIVTELIKLRASIDALSANTGKWLAAVAKAAATPEDNSTEVQQLIDEIATQINTSSDATEQTLNQQTKGDS